jgi:PAS domain S-box-containing protein
MADNSQEIFWVIDAETKKATFVNPAYETITGRSCRSLVENPSSYADAFHPDDRVPVLARLDEAVRTGSFDERFRIVKPDGEIRWVWMRGFPRRDANGKITRLGELRWTSPRSRKLKTKLQPILRRRTRPGRKPRPCARRHLLLPKTFTWIVFSMHYSDPWLVPYTCARVLVPEGGPHWLALGENHLLNPRKNLRAAHSHSLPISLRSSSVSGPSGNAP